MQATMHRNQAASGFFVLLVIVSIEAQVKRTIIWFNEEHFRPIHVKIPINKKIVVNKNKKFNSLVNPLSVAECCDGCSGANTNPNVELGGDAQSQYLIRVYDVAAITSKAFFVTSNISFTDFELKPLNEYEITILGRDGELYSMKVSDLRRGPGKIRNLQLTSISETKAELHWEPPLYQTGAILRYSVSLKRNKLLGCKDLGKLTPPQNELLQNVTNTTASFINLHPYADYTINVIAHTSFPGPQQTINFRTSQLHIPTSVVSNLRLSKNRNRLEWDEPQDCTTISGTTLGARLFFEDVSDSVQNWTSLQVPTYYNYFNLKRIQLAPYELYRVRVHVIRSYDHPVNLTHYQELTWRTPPAAPPAVRLLEIYDLDVDENSISIRWIPPLPANGEIESYHISINSENEPLTKWTVAISETGLECKQWENYVCFERLTLPSNVTTDWNKVEVYAMNKDVATLGAPATLVFTADSMYNKAPSKPLNLTAVLRPKGMATLKWAHPLITYTKLARYRMRFDVLDTEQYFNKAPQLPITVEYSVDLENRDYSVEIKLQGSTTYHIYVAAVNRQNLSSPETHVEVSVPQLEDTYLPVSIEPA